MSERAFKAIPWRSVTENFSETLSEKWMLVTPGVPGRWNTMTASWGGFGHLWTMDVAFVFVRPSRHTFGFMEREEGFTLSFFNDDSRGALDICGSVSGRDRDKAAAAGITPRPFPARSEGARSVAPDRVGFEEARLVLSCRKIYSGDFDPERFLDPAISRNYPAGDVHRVYIGAIESAWRRE